MLGRLRSFFSTKGALGNPPQALLDALGVGPSSASMSPDVALRVPAVSAAVRAISEATACLPLSIYRVGPDASREEAVDHPVYPLLKGDWNDWTGAFDGLLATTVDALCNDSGGLVWVNRIDGVPRELIRYRPGSFTVDYDLATGEPTFRLATADGGNRPLPLNEVVHVRAFGAVNRAPLSLAREAISLSILLGEHATKLFARGARPSGILKIPGRLNQAGLERLKVSWAEAYGGVANSGRTAILEENTSWEPITFNSVDAQFLELRQFQVLEIARAFRIPPHMLFELSRATWSNTEALGREFLVFSLQPMLRAWESALRRVLLTPEERRDYVIEFDEDDLTQANIADRATAYSSLIACRVINPNTARKWERLPPYQGGEEYVNPNITTGAPAPAKPRAVA